MVRFFINIIIIIAQVGANHRLPFAFALAARRCRFQRPHRSHLIEYSRCYPNHAELWVIGGSGIVAYAHGEFVEELGGLEALGGGGGGQETERERQEGRQTERRQGLLKGDSVGHIGFS